MATPGKVRTRLIKTKLTLSTTYRGVPSRQPQEVQRPLLLLQLDTYALYLGQKRDLPGSPDELQTRIVGSKSIERPIDALCRLLPTDDIDTSRPLALADRGESLDHCLADARRSAHKDGCAGIGIGVDAGVGRLHLLAGDTWLSRHGAMGKIQLKMIVLDDSDETREKYLLASDIHLVFKRSMAIYICNRRVRVLEDTRSGLSYNGTVWLLTFDQPRQHVDMVSRALSWHLVTRICASFVYLKWISA